MELDDKGMAKALQIDTNAIMQLSDAFNQASKKTSSFGSIVEVAIGNLAANAFARLADAIRTVPGAVIRMGSQVESSLAELSAITGIAGRDLERLGETAVRESMRTGVAAADQIEAFKLLASNIDVATLGGVAGLESLASQVILLKQAAGVGLAEATNIVTGSINAFGLEATRGAEVVNLLAAGSKFGAAEVSDLGAALKNSAATARGANVSIQETVGALEVMSQNFLKGGEAGTGLRNVISIIQTESEKLAGAGIKNVNIESEGLTASLVKLKPLLSDAAGLSEIFGRENANAARILIQNAEAVGTMTEKVTGTDTAIEQAAIRTETFQGSLDRLLATIQGVGIGLFQEYSDELKGLVDTTIDLINYLRENKEEVLTIAQVLGMATAAVVAYNAVVKIQTLVTNAATIAQRLLNLAMKLNPVGLVISALTILTLLFIKFRDKIAAAAAVMVQFGISSVQSLKTISDALGLGLVSKGTDMAIAKLETLRDRLLDAASAANKARNAGAFGGAGVSGEFEPGASPSRGSLRRPKKEDDTSPASPKKELEDELTLLKQKQAELIKTGQITEELIRLNSQIAQIERERALAAKGSIIEKIELTGAEIEAKDELKRKEEEMMALHIQRTESELEQAARRIRAAEEEKRIKEELAKQEQEHAQMILENAAAQGMAADSVTDAVRASVKQIVQALLAEFIARILVKTVGQMGPLGLLLAAPIAAAAGATFTSAIPGFAEGGTIKGPGGIDNVLTRLTAGEEVINAQAASRNRPLLKAINAGMPASSAASMMGSVDVRVSGELTANNERIVARINETNTTIDATRGQVRTTRPGQ